MRIGLVTEGNYPVVRGGVTRWCELLMDGLAHHQWHVTALGVRDGDVGNRRAAIDCVSPEQLSVQRSWRGRISMLPAAVAAQLGSAEADPVALAETLAACSTRPELASRLGSPGTLRAITATLQCVLGPHGADPKAVQIALQRTLEVVAIAIRAQPEVHRFIAASAGSAVVPGLVARQRWGTPLILVEHGVAVREVYLRTMGPDVGPGERAAARRCALNLARAGYAMSSAVVGVTPANASWSVALGADPRRVSVVPNGVAIPAHRPALPRTDTVGMVGRVDPFKGVDVFVRAAELVAERRPEATFVHVGPAEPCHREYLAACQDLVVEAGLTERFRFVGEVEDVDAQLAAMDVAVLPSRTEGLPYALLEAMAAGRPVVASAVGGVPELVRGAGRLVDPEDHVALAEEVLLLLSDRSRARRLGRAGAARVRERYPLAQTLEGIDTVVSAVGERVELAS